VEFRFGFLVELSRRRSRSDRPRRKPWRCPAAALSEGTHPTRDRAGRRLCPRDRSGGQEIPFEAGPPRAAKGNDGDSGCLRPSRPAPNFRYRFKRYSALGTGLFEGFSARIGQNETGDRRSEEEKDRARRRPEKMKSDPEGGNCPRRGEADQVSGPDPFERASRARRGPATSQCGRKQVLSGTESHQSPAHSCRGS
jgi:hypothetical protein